MEQMLSSKCAAKTYWGIARVSCVALNVPVPELRGAYGQISAAKGHMGGSSPA